MGKITVKHYLNKRLQSKEIHNVQKFPLYVQITVERKTTQLKSLTGLYLSDNEFCNLNDENIGANLKCKDLNSIVKEVNFWDISKEKELIYKVVTYSVEKKKYKVGSNDLNRIIQFYSQEIIQLFAKYIFIGANIIPTLLDVKKVAPIALYITDKSNPFDVLQALEEVTNIDIFSKLNTQQRELIYSFNEIISVDYDRNEVIYWYNGELLEAYNLRHKYNTNVVKLISKIANELENEIWQ